MSTAEVEHRDGMFWVEHKHPLIYFDNLWPPKAGMSGSQLKSAHCIRLNDESLRPQQRHALIGLTYLIGDNRQAIALIAAS
jgi:hypothetical protein